MPFIVLSNGGQAIRRSLIGNWLRLVVQEDDPRSYLREVAGNLEKLSDRPTLIVWGTIDFVFGECERTRFERIFPDHVSVLFDIGA